MFFWAWEEHKNRMARARDELARALDEARAEGLTEGLAEVALRVAPRQPRNMRQLWPWQPENEKNPWQQPENERWQKELTSTST